jgi:two-component system chemotaxis response regulator CheB
LPDVVILDLVMPEMSGITFLQILMNQCPLPVIIFSAYANKSTELGKKALRMGACGIIEKPKCTIEELEDKIRETFIKKINDSVVNFKKPSQKDLHKNTNIEYSSNKEHDSESLRPGVITDKITNSIRVLIVDDSAVVRIILGAIIDEQHDMQVMATAEDPYMAADIMRKETPDVIILDIEMPRMDGLTFLKKINLNKPVPVIICSSMVNEQSKLLFDAIEEGAFDIIYKPRITVKEHLASISSYLVESVRSAAISKNKKVNYSSKLTISLKSCAKINLKAKTNGNKIVLIGASTGGVRAIQFILSALPAASPPIVIVQHMAAQYTRQFTERLNVNCAINIKLAEDGEKIYFGNAYLAPGDSHMEIDARGGEYYIKLVNGPPINRHRPSVDVLFASAAKNIKASAVGVLLTGMGKDGARSLKEMRNSGAYTIAQNEETSIVYGMPKAAIEIDAVDKVLPLQNIPQEILLSQY